MKKTDGVYIRITSDLREALEKERKRVSEKAGVEVQMSAVVRSLLEKALGLPS